MQEVDSIPHARKVAIFRIALGPEARRLVRNQDVPTERDAEKGRHEGQHSNEDDAKAAMGETSDTYELHVFLHRLQRDGESIDEFLASLKELRKYRDLCDCMKDQLLKHQIITGIPDMTLQAKLLQERNLDLDLEKCIDMCCAAESAASKVKDVFTTKTEVDKIGFPRQVRRWTPRHHTGNGAEAKAAKRRCFFCGRWHQLCPGMCPARGKTCNKCGKIDHFAVEVWQLCCPPSGSRQRCNRQPHQGQTPQSRTCHPTPI